MDYIWSYIKNSKVTSIPEFLNIAPALPWGKDTAMAIIEKNDDRMFLCTLEYLGFS